MRLSVLLALVALPLVSATSLAQPAPYRQYRTLATPHFRVHVAAGLEREGRVAGAAAERAYALLSRELHPPRGTIDLVVSDDADYSNGYATPFPSNRIVVFATPPIETGGLRFNEDWLQLVVTHELTHIFHLDRVRGVWEGLQHVFGRAPFLFPNSYGPSWLTEGLAVYYESRLTEGGRLKSSNERLLARAAAAEGRLPQLNELSLGTPRFPGGEGAYAYGSLFLDYLSRTRGDSAVGQFVERQSAQLIPFWINHAASQGFGVSFSDAFNSWRDSVIASVGAPVPPLPGWRELTTQGYYASDPRWLDDTTIVYTGSDGRVSNAAWKLRLDGSRTRISRRTGSSPNVRAPDGSLVFSQLEYVGRDEVRSDLYRENDAGVTRLTYGARLVEPDVRHDGVIVAAEIVPTGSRLVLVTPERRDQRVLRGAHPDETWSEPRWSPDGTRIAAIHRQHGGLFSLEILSAQTGDVQNVIAQGHFVIASPSWAAEDDRIVFVSEEGGTPQLAYARSHWTDSASVAPRADAPPVFTPDVSPSGRNVTAVSLRADGYHIGVTETPLKEVAQLPGRSVAMQQVVAVDSQPLAAGEYTDYSPLQTLLPRYWLPVAEGGGFFTPQRIGATTTGSDIIGRHLYAADASIERSGHRFEGSLTYRYAGFRQPMLDVSLSQQWTGYTVYSIDQFGTMAVLGTLFQRKRDASLAMTLARPRMRTYASVSLGAGVEHHDFDTDPSSLRAKLDTSLHGYTFPRLFASGVWSNVQRPPLSISPEDGVQLIGTFRQRAQLGAFSRTASSSVIGVASAYKSLDLPGFAHHVLALRVAGGWNDRRSGTSFEVGGTSGNVIELLSMYTLGEGRRTFGVRGFPEASTYGTQAYAASLEYRAPLALGGRGLALLPFFFDRSSITAFADAGAAGCVSQPLYSGVCAPPAFLNRTLASLGGELNLSASVFDWDAPQSFRIGVAVPVAGRALTGANPATAYLAFGISF